MQLVANLTMMFTELPVPERFGAAARAGFEGVEIQFPYEFDPAELRRASADRPVVLINAPASDPRGSNGRATDAALRAEFRQGLDEAMRFAEALRVSKLNVLPGPPPPGQDAATTDAVLGDNLRLAAERMGGIGVAVVTEAINPWDVPGMWLNSLGKALSFLDGLDEPRVKLQFDLYHMARTEPDLVAAIATAGPRIGHVQFADTEGRHEPGTGTIDFDAAFAALHRAGYDGAVAAEYRPAGRTEDGLGWMARVPGWFGRV
ncbi:hydroxypyruvate isomerase family protein [uncultured Enterovirga sp.]|uniref:hydroxypyruvate isomerase family protein n=1 Tax=uncultured Enterovirga sp. TaxID=2026352 RepID=UPI0035C9FBBE